MVRLTLDYPRRATGKASRGERVRVVVRRDNRGGGVHVTLAGLATAASEYASERTIDVHIRRLRVKTGQPLVATVYRVGYRLHEDTVAAVIRET